jgi:hypothetical protein
MSKKSNWSIALIQLAVIFTACACAAQELLPVTNIEKPNVSGNSVPSHTEPAGPMPILAFSDCNELHRLLKENSSKSSIKSEDAQVINDVLNATGNHHVSTIFRLMPDQVTWWVRFTGSISILSLGTAIHESNHIVDAVLTHCNNGFSTYLLEGHVIKTDHKFGDSPKYSIAADMLPLKFKTNSMGSRFHLYIEQNGSHAESDFSILLDELVAYTGAASLDISILRSTEYSWLVDRQVAWFDVNPGGMADFMIYTLAYLKALRVNYPEAYLRLQQQPKTLALLQVIWSAAETTLVSAYDLTTKANNGGILRISRDAIAAAYSDEFLGELDRLGIKHASINSWRTSYLNSVN